VKNCQLATSNYRARDVSPLRSWRCSRPQTIPLQPCRPDSRPANLTSGNQAEEDIWRGSVLLCGAPAAPSATANGVANSEGGVANSTVARSDALRKAERVHPVYRRWRGRRFNVPVERSRLVGEIDAFLFGLTRYRKVNAELTSMTRREHTGNFDTPAGLGHTDSISRISALKLRLGLVNSLARSTS
jgi:hypothetical protein